MLLTLRKAVKFPVGPLIRGSRGDAFKNLRSTSNAAVSLSVVVE